MKRLTKVLIVLALTFAVTLVMATIAQIVLRAQEPPNRPKPPEPPAPPELVETLGPVQTVGYLTEDERNTVMSIINSDDCVRGILEKGNWTVQLMGPWTNGTERLGAGVLIRFEGSVWVEGRFYDPPSGFSYTAKLWAGNLHVFVDLRANRVVGLEPGLGMVMGKAPIMDEELVVAERVALNHTLVKTLGENIESYLNAVYYTPDYVGGIAVFSIRSDQEEVLVAVDLKKMMVVEKYTGSVMRLER